MAMVSYTYQGVTRSYTPIALDKLDEVRLRLRADLAELKSRTGEEYILSRPASTLKSNAYAAKIGVYKLEKRTKRCVWADLKYYV